MLSLDSDHRVIRNIMKKHKELKHYLLKQSFIIALGKMQLWWYVFF